MAEQKEALEAAAEEWADANTYECDDGSPWCTANTRGSIKEAFIAGAQYALAAQALASSVGQVGCYHPTVTWGKNQIVKCDMCGAELTPNEAFVKAFEKITAKHRREG